MNFDLTPSFNSKICASPEDWFKIIFKEMLLLKLLPYPHFSWLYQLNNICAYMNFRLFDIDCLCRSLFEKLKKKDVCIFVRQYNLSINCYICPEDIKLAYVCNYTLSIKCWIAIIFLVISFQSLQKVFTRNKTS